MANEYSTLAVVYDEQLDAEITVKRCYQENGGQGIEIAVKTNEAGRIDRWECFQVRDIRSAS